jgi:hypothetical protein
MSSISKATAIIKRSIRKKKMLRRGCVREFVRDLTFGWKMVLLRFAASTCSRNGDEDFVLFNILFIFSHSNVIKTIIKCENGFRCIGAAPSPSFFLWFLIFRSSAIDFPIENFHSLRNGSVFLLFART